MLACLPLLVGWFTLTVLEGEHFSFIQIAFEVASALQLWVLSTGITPSLGAAAKITLMLLHVRGPAWPHHRSDELESQAVGAAACRGTNLHWIIVGVFRMNMKKTGS